MEAYLEQLQGAFPRKSEPELELLCASSRHIRRGTGLSAHEHRKRAMQKLFPKRVWHDWREERIASVQECIEGRIKELSWIGSSNSNKTGDMADIALSLWWQKPEDTSIYVASPFESATATGVWAEIQDQFIAAKALYKNLPGEIRHSDNSIVMFDRNPRSFIRVATVDSVGKLVGKKSRDTESGMLVFILDELVAFTPSAGRALMEVLDNLISVRNVIIIAAGNFASTWDTLGQFCDPNEDDIPGGYEGFNADTHFRWKTKRGGICLRFDGLQSPNVKAGKDLYPFLTTIEYIETMARRPGGLESPNAMRFIRSAPVTNLDQFSVTSMERIRAGGCYEDVEWTADPIQYGAFIDPGFSGDDCVVQKFKLGTAKIGASVRQVVCLWESPFVVPVRVNAKQPDGSPYLVEDQMVDGAMNHCRAKRVEDSNVGFDPSMRPQIVQNFARRWSTRVKVIDSFGPATERKVNATEKKTWKTEADRLISEQWFVVEMLIDTGQIRGLSLSPKAIQQLTTRRWGWAAKNRGKRRIQDKKEYKDMLIARGMVGESPNEADALVGCVELARGMGLALNGVVINGGSLNLLLSMRNEFNFKQAKHFALTKGRSELPTGRLHGMKALTDSRNGRLHRR